MYYVFLSVTGLLTFLDLGFSGTIGRFVSYAMAGAKEVKAQGFVPSSVESGGPNFQLLWRLLRTTRKLYFFVALMGLLVMGVWGTVLVMRSVAETPNPRLTWVAWAITLAAAGFELYSIWWNSYLYAINRVQESTRIGFLAYTLRLVLSCTFLLLNMGLASVPAAALIGAIANRHFSRRSVLRALGEPSEQSGGLEKSLLPIMWPNSWRLAVQTLSVYLRTNALTQICMIVFGLRATAEYGLSLQIINIAAGMSMVWTSVKWPQVGQLRSRQDTPGLRKLLWPRVWLLLGTFVILCALAIVIGPPLLKLLGTDKRMLPAGLLVIAAIYSMLDVHFVFWSTLLAIENRIPTLWTTVATNVTSLALGITLSTTIGVSGLMVAPLISGVVFIYWYWPAAGARSLDSTWTRFMFKHHA